MPANTPNRSYPYPLGPDPIDTAGDIERLAKAIDLDIGGGGSGSGGNVGGFTFIQDTAPSGTIKHGAMWYDTSTGLSYVYVIDANSSQWVQFAPGSAPDVLGPQFRIMTFGTLSVPGSAITYLGFNAVAGAVLGTAIGNRVSGYFSLQEKGVYTVQVQCTWSTSWGNIGMAMDLDYTDNQGTNTQSLGTQLCGPSPWAYTQNVFQIDAVASATREYNLRVYNYNATLTAQSIAVIVTRVSTRP